ncbi:MAG: hypothetical protein WD688_01710 [Candidatus Binatia bacterium]
MAGKKIDFGAAAEAKAKSRGDADRTNERSAIAFPYLDLNAAVEVAKALYSRRGISSCALDELAAALSQTTSSGNFRLKTSTARTFGLIDKDGQSAFKLSELGCRLVSPEGETDAKADAFLQVPLYNQIYEKYRGKLLPPTKALEREMQTLGVSSKQTDKARHAFQRSARQAGFFNDGEDRLVRPRATGVAGNVETISQSAADNLPDERNTYERRGGGSNGGSGGNYHPFIQGLLKTLPEPDTVWSVEGRAAWLRAAAYNFTLMYQGEGQVLIEVQEKDKSGKETATSKKVAAA